MEAALTLPGSRVTVPNGDHDLHGLMVDCATRANDADALRLRLPPAEEAADRSGHRFYQAVVERGWGVYYRLTGSLAEAQARLAKSANDFAALGMPWQQARAHADLALALISTGKTAEARATLELALSAFESLGAAPDVARARELIHTLP